MRRLPQFLFTLLLACDPRGAATQDSPAAAPGEAKIVPAITSLSECLSSCEQTETVATNLATCRLNCDTAFGADAREAPPPDDPVALVAGCLARCHQERGGDADCAGACETTAAATTPPVPAEVLSQLGACVRACHGDPAVHPTDLATCRLNCAQLARVRAAPPPTQPAPGS